VKILFVIHALSGGGAEHTAVRLMNRLSRSHDVTVCLIQKRRQDQEYPLSGSVKVIELPQTECHPTEGYIPQWRRELKRIKREGRYQVAVSFLEQGNYLNVSTRPLFGQRTIVSVRNLSSLKQRLKPSPDGLIEKKKWLDRFADKVVCVSEDVAGDQRRNFGIPARKLCVIRNWIDADDVRRQVEEGVRDPEFEAFSAAHPFLVANSGRLDIQKGQKHLLRAFAALHREHPETGLMILGTGNHTMDLREELTAEADRLGIADSVLFCGKKRMPCAYLARADVFVLSSLYEGFSNSLLEAMAAGLPVISTDCAGTRELLTPDRRAGTTVKEPLKGAYGIVTPLPDIRLEQPDVPARPTAAEEESGRKPAEKPALDRAEAGLLSAMEMLCQDKELREHYRQAGARRILDFSPERIFPEWERVLAGKH